MQPIATDKKAFLNTLRRVYQRSYKQRRWADGRPIKCSSGINANLDRILIRDAKDRNDVASEVRNIMEALCVNYDSAVRILAGGYV